MASARNKIQNPYGIHAGQLVHISDVSRGLACNCTCPGCGATLVARRGKEKVEHFQHYQSEDCGTALESALHLMAKDILALRKEITLPALTTYLEEDGDPYVHQVLMPVQTVPLDSVVLEKICGVIIPDVVATSKGRRLIIEIAVTHFCDEAKIASIEKLGMSAIEIDLSELHRTGFTRDTVERAIVHGVTKKRWLYHANENMLTLRRQGAIRKAELQRKQEKVEREEWYRQYYKPVESLYAGNGQSLSGMVVGCGLDKRNWIVDGKQSYVAHRYSDCPSCPHFRGTRKDGKYVVCLYKYNIQHSQSKPLPFDELGW